MKRIFLIMLLSLILKNVDAQRMYTWCPIPLKSPPRTEQLKNIEINVLINDIRSEESKNKCTPEEFTRSIINTIKAAYPSSTIIKVVDSKEKTESGKIFVEIDIFSYFASFRGAMWYAQTDFSIKISDFRNSTAQEYSQDIHKEKKSFNLNGFNTAKNILNETYIKAITELLDFVSDKLNH